MNLINQTSSPNQKQTMVLEDGSSFTYQISYKRMQYGWFFTSLTYKDFTVTGMRVVTSPNILHQFRHRLPFGIACYVVGNREPSQKDDFKSKNANLYVLTAAEVATVSRFLIGQA